MESHLAYLGKEVEKSGIARLHEDPEALRTHVQKALKDITASSYIYPHQVKSAITDFLKVLAGEIQPGGLFGKVTRRVHAVERVSFDLYPGAQVVASLMNGMSLSIRSDASFEEIVTFYEKQLTERKWEIQSRKMTNGKMVLKSVNHASPEEVMSIAIAPAEKSGRYNLVFIKLLVDN